MSDEIPKLGIPYASANGGFPGIAFRDFYDNKCSLQMSSLCEGFPPGQSALWLGTDKDRMHLSREQVVSLMYELDCWLRDGVFQFQKEEGQ